MKNHRRLLPQKPMRGHSILSALWGLLAFVSFIVPGVLLFHAWSGRALASGGLFFYALLLVCGLAFAESRKFQPRQIALSGDCQP